MSGSIGVLSGAGVKRGGARRSPSPALAALLSALLVAAALAGPATATPGPKGPPPGAPAPEGMTKVIVSFNQPPRAAAAEAIQAAGGQIRLRLGLINAVAATVPEGAIRGLRAHPLVTAVEFDHPLELFHHGPNTGNPELEAAWGVEHIGAGYVHTAGNTGQGVKVGVIDTGVDYTHQELAAAYAGGYDFFNNDDDPFDDFGHGTHVSGSLLAAAGNGGVVGVAPGASLYGYKVLSASGEGDYSGLIAALGRAVSDGMDVVNMSLGGNDPSSALEQAVQAAYAQGVVMVAASGNVNPFDIWELFFGCAVKYPARYAEVYATTFTAQNNELTGYSCTGPEIDFASPGDNIYSSVPTGSCVLCSSSGYLTASGTSMASPHLAGTVALVLSHGITNDGDPASLADDVKAHLCANTMLGFGVLTTPIPPDDPRYPEYFGCGVVDAKAALVDNPPDGGEPPPPPPPNTPPVANDDLATVAEDGSVIIDVLANDTDADNDPLTVAAVSQPAHGTASIQDNMVVYTPDANYFGEDSFEYTVSDGTDTASATVSVTVTPVNDPPVASPASVTTDSETPVTVTLSATDVDDCELGFVVTGFPANGTLGPLVEFDCTAGSPNSDTATIVYTPNASFSGGDSFTYRAWDGDAYSEPATVSVSVNEPAPPPPPPPPGPTMHIADLDGSSSTQGRQWTAKVTISVESDTGAKLSGATVTGTWSSGGTVSCSTKGGGAQAGTCTVQSAKLPATVDSVTFTVTAVTLSGYTYEAGNNYDPDGDSDGTSIVVRR